jgi:hypothetical protein
LARYSPCLWERNTIVDGCDYFVQVANGDADKEKLIADTQVRARDRAAHAGTHAQVLYNPRNSTKRATPRMKVFTHKTVETKPNRELGRGPKTLIKQKMEDRPRQQLSRDIENTA